MSVDALIADTATVISPIWFEQFSGSTSSDSGSNSISLEESVERIQWKEQSLEVFSNEWIVQLDWSVASSLTSLSDAGNLLASTGFTYDIIGGLGIGGQMLLRTSDASMDQVDSWLSSSSAVTYFEPNAVLPVDQVPDGSSFSSLWGLNNTGQTGGTVDADIDAVEAWDISTGSSNIVVAVIDTGVDYTHPDLINNIWTNPGEISGNGIDDDGNGFIDDIHGYDFANNDGDPMDDNGHGTHVSGTIAGDGNNGTGVAGVNWNASIMGLKFLSAGGSGSLANAVRAVNYATMMKTMYDVNVKVTNNSWGGGGYSQALYDAIAASGTADILFVAAAGNSANNNDATASYPATYNLDNVISVAATDYNDNLAYFSSYGATTVDLAAPGVSIYSTTPGNNYASYSGTSMATPHVAGVAALAWSVNPNATAAQIKAAILNGVDQISSLNGKVLTGGRLNAFNTLSAMGMSVSGSSIAEGEVLSSAPTSFTLDFNRAYDAASINASDLTVNGIAAESFTLVDSDTITFQYNTSPVTSEGTQTMQVAAGVIQRSGSSDTINDWQRSFFYDTFAMQVVSATPDDGQLLTLKPAYIDIRLNEAVDPLSIGIDDLTLSEGTVTAATLVDAFTVRYTINTPVTEGQLSYTLNKGELTDIHGNPGPSYTATMTIDDPSITRYQSPDLNVPLTDNALTWSSLTIADSGTIADLNVELDITHTWDSDLDIWLYAPDGTVVELFTDVGGSGDNFTGTILDDEASTSILSGSAPFTGRYRPEGLLSTFDGKDTAGTWWLGIRDDYAADAGVLNSWSLLIDANQAPTLASIADQSILHSQDTIQITLNGNDVDGDSLTYTAAFVSTVNPLAQKAYDLDQQLGLEFKTSYYENWGGAGEKWLWSTVDSIGYFITPDGSLYKWTGASSGANFLSGSQFIDTLDASFHADPTKLFNALQPNSSVDVGGSQLVIVGNQLTVDPADGFLGDLNIRVNVSDGRVSATQTFTVSVTNAVPTLNLVDQNLSHTQGSLVIDLPATDADGESVTYTAVFVDALAQKAYDLDQQLGLEFKNSYYENWGGAGEKWLWSTVDSVGYFITSDGSLYKWTGASPGANFLADSQFIDTLDASYHADPTTLFNATPPVPSGNMGNNQVTIVGTQLTLTPDSSYLGPLTIIVSATDGIETTTKTFTVTVTNAAPTLNLVDQNLSHAQASLVIDLPATDADGESVSYTAAFVSTVDPVAQKAYDLDQQLGLEFKNSYYENWGGAGEKWLWSTVDSVGYFITPDGSLYKWTGASSGANFLADSQLIDMLDASYHADPTTLFQATQPTPSANVGNSQVTIVGNQLTLTPDSIYLGPLSIQVTATDGLETTTQTFVVTVTNSAPVLNIADQTLADDVGPLTINLPSTDADGETVSYTAGFTSSIDATAQKAYDLDQQLGLEFKNSYYENWGGAGEKWLWSTVDSVGYFITPDGSLYKWTGASSGANFLADSQLIDTLDASYHADPTTLYQASQPTPSADVGGSLVTIVGNQLTVTPGSSFLGDLVIQVTATDGVMTTTQTFTVTVVDGSLVLGLSTDSTSTVDTVFAEWDGLESL